jgi:hypothetical protein
MTINYSKQVLLKRGNTAVSSTYTGPVGEVTLDTDLMQLRVHNGNIAGGFLTASDSSLNSFKTYANANAATQTTEINSLRANITAANAAITSLQSNAAIQATVLDTLTGNAATQSQVLDTLTSNAAAQATSLTTLLGNAVAQQTSLIDLVANAATQAQAIASVTGTYSNANVATYLSAFDGNILPSANVTYSLGSETRQWRDLWVSNNTIYIGNTPIRVDGGTLLVNGAPVSGTYGNTQVAEYLPTYSGNVRAEYVIMSFGGLITTGASPAPIISGFRSISTAGNAPNEGNITASGNLVASRGAYITGNVTAGNLTITGNLDQPNRGFGNGPGTDLYITAGHTQGCSIPGGDTIISGGLGYNGIAHNGGNVTLRTGDYYSKQWNFDYAGNLIIPGNINFANGVNILSTVGGTYANANVAEYLPTYSGNIAANIVKNGYTWTFSNTGNLAYPDGTISTGGAVYAAANASVQLISNNENTQVRVDNSNVEIYTSPNGITQYQWTFGNTGNLALPAGGVIAEGGGISGAIRLTPSGGANANQALLIYPTGNAEGDHVHLTTGGGSTELYLGNDFHYVKLVDGGNIELRATTANLSAQASWNFDTTGNIDARQTLGIKVPDGVPTNVAVINSTTGSWEMNPNLSLATTGGSGSGLTVNVAEEGGYASTIEIATAGTGYTNGDLITVTSGTSNATFTIVIAGRNTWQFGGTGNLTLPQTGYLRVGTGIVAGFASSPAPIISGFSSISAENFTFLGNGVNILSTVGAGGTTDRLTNGGSEVVLQANGVTTFGNTATISNNGGEFRIWADNDISVYRNGRDGYGIAENEVKVFADNTQITATTPDGLEIKQGNLVIPNDKAVVFANGVNILSTVAGTYGNAEVAAYLPTYSGNVRALNFVGATQAQVGSSFAYAQNAFGVGSDTGGVFLPADTNSNAVVAGYTIVSNAGVTLTVTSASFVAGTPNFISVSTTPTASSFVYPVTVYSADYSPALPLSTITVGNATISGNVTAPRYLFANGVNILSTVAGTYGNTQVASYLLNFDGDIEFTSSTAKIGNVDVITVMDSIRSPAYQFSNGVSIFSGITGTYSNTNVAAYLTTGVTTANLTTTGNVVQQSAYYETYANVTNSGGNLTCNFVNGATFYATLTANVTVNFTNVVATAGRVTGATLIVDQGATAYRVANIQINSGGVQTIKYAGGTPNTGTASNTDIMSFSLISLDGTNWRVLGQISNYG